MRSYLREFLLQRYIELSNLVIIRVCALIQVLSFVLDNPLFCLLCVFLSWGLWLFNIHLMHALNLIVVGGVTIVNNAAVILLLMFFRSGETV